MYGARAKAWGLREGQYRQLARMLDTPGDTIQSYRPVIIDRAQSVAVERYSKQIPVYRVASAKNNIFFSDSVKLKPRELHRFDKSISKSFEMLGEANNPNKPMICIVSPLEMQSTAVASYEPCKNILYVNEAIFANPQLNNLQSSFTCSDHPLSTMLHELIHWQDADRYRKKYGEITDFNRYIDYLNKKFAPKLDRLKRRGYNIYGVSEYATTSFMDNRLDEFYTEYRVKRLLEG